MHGYGTKFYRSTDNSTFTQVAGLIDVETPEISRETYETTLMDNSDSANGWKKFKGALLDPGELSLTLEWDADDSGQTALRADLEVDDPRYYRVEYPGGETFSFEAVLTSFGQSTPIADRITRSCKFKLSGEPAEA